MFTGSSSTTQRNVNQIPGPKEQRDIFLGKGFTEFSLCANLEKCEDIREISLILNTSFFLTCISSDRSSVKNDF